MLVHLRFKSTKVVNNICLGAERRIREKERDKGNGKQEKRETTEGERMEREKKEGGERRKERGGRRKREEKGRKGGEREESRKLKHTLL